MNCPFCKKPLIEGKLREFETTSDHVSNPNAEHYPMRKTFECSCTPKGFWDDYGSFYGDKDNIEFDFIYYHSALNSWERKHHQIQKLSDKIRPYLFWVEYKYDTAYKIAKFFVR